MNNIKLITASVLLTFISGCSTSLTKKNEEDIKDTRSHLQTIIKEQKSEKSSNFTEQDGPSISIKPLSHSQQEAKEKEWLTNIQHISLDPAKNSAIPANAIIRMFRDKGINIVTALPLDSYTYTGFGVTNVNAETALMVFMGAMGLDFDIDNSRQIITIEPMKPQTWTFNIGNRRTSFNTGSNASTTNSASANMQGGTTAQTPAGGALGAAPSGAMSSAPQTTQSIQSTASTTGGSNSIGISSSDDVWGKLSSELTQRLTILVPKTNASNNNSYGQMPIVPAIGQMQGLPPLPMGIPGTPSMGIPIQGDMSTLYTTQTVGRFSINAETGAITVQAPKYILKPLGDYLTKVQEMYNTTITFEGELVTVTTSNNVSEGIDWSSFNGFAGNGYSSVVQNNILGGAVITQAAGTGAVANALTIANNTIPGANTLLGIVSANKKFAVFNAFLSSVGQLKIKDTPLVTTTSGTPVKFKNTTTRHYQQYNQTAASGGVGSAAVATNTVDVSYDTGMTLHLNPRYDVNTGLVRTQFSLDRTMINGWEQKINPISTGNTVQIINTQLPILANTMNDGELLLKNNDLVVVGGLTEDAEDNNDAGITGLINGPLKSLTGKGTRNKTTTTYYFALRVSISKKD